MIIDLSAREKEILRSFAVIGRSQDVADSLYLSIKTVETHLVRIRRRAGLTTTLEAIALLFDQIDILYIESRTCPITPREIEVLNLLSLGKSAPSIAEAMGVSKRTVELHLYRLLQKSGLRNKYQLAACFRLHPERFVPPKF